jgi:hypothetical protein
MRTSNKNAVIVSHKTPETMFWTGKNWTKEYPDAMKYSVSEARETTKRIHPDLFDRSVRIVVDYGLEDEHEAK